MNAKYTINEVAFTTKKQIEQHVRAILGRSEVGYKLPKDDFDFVLDLLNLHPRAKQKIGAGVVAIRVDLNTEWKAWKMFTLIRCDGSETDFSYRACIYARSKQQEFSQACRQAVAPDIVQFKRDYYTENADETNCVVCPVDNKLVSWDEAHVDHDHPWPFREIVKCFCAERCIKVDEIELDGDDDGECQYRFRDLNMTDDFREFHRQRACLRVVSREANLCAKRV